MATTDIVQRVKTLLYGSGIGEKPVLILGAADASESLAGTPIITFDIADGTQVAAGDVLSVVGAATAADAHMFYVTGVSTNTITAYEGYLGSPFTAANDLDSAVFELGHTKSEHFIYQAIETIFTTMLFPDIHKYATYSITPDLSDYQVEVAAVVESIESAWQNIGGQKVQIPFELQKHVHTTVSSTGSLAQLFSIDGSSVFVTTREKYLEADTLSEALTQCIATGAAALVLGATRAHTDMEAASKDSQFRGQRNPADQLWRDFVTIRSSIIEDLASQVDWFEIRRG